MEIVRRTFPGVGDFLVVEREYEVVAEEWARYDLLDGGRMRVKTVVHKIWEVVDEQGNPVKQPNGDRFLLVESMLVGSSSS